MRARYYLGAALAVSMIAGPVTAGEIYFDFNINGESTEPNASVFLFGTAGQTATVSNLAGFNQNVILGLDGFFNLPIPSIYQQSGTGVRDTGFKVVSPNAIGGYFLNRALFTTDIAYLLDRSALSTSYVVASQGPGFGEGGQVAIHAVQDNTAVVFTPKGAAPVNVVLNAGQTYKYTSDARDLTGSFVMSDKAVAVFGGHECALVPFETFGCNTLLEQMIPVEKLSTTYVVTATEGAAAAVSVSDLVKVVATQDGTLVLVGGETVAFLNAGDTHEFSIDAGTGTTIAATYPVLVAQYLTGGSGAPTDPAFTLVPGVDSFLARYRLATPSGAQAFDVNYASLVVETADLASLLLDGTAVDTGGFSAIADSIYSRGSVSLPLGLFDLEADSPFLVLLGGGSVADGYLTYGGETFAFGSSTPHADVPEPASMALLGAGLLGIAAARRRGH